jgi:hypothetical protein
MLSVHMLSFVMHNIIMPSVVAPANDHLRVGTQLKCYLRPELKQPNLTPR